MIKVLYDPTTQTEYLSTNAPPERPMPVPADDGDTVHQVTLTLWQMRTIETALRRNRKWLEEHGPQHAAEISDVDEVLSLFNGGSYAG